MCACVRVRVSVLNHDFISAVVYGLCIVILHEFIVVEKVSLLFIIIVVLVSSFHVLFMCEMAF